MITYKPLKNYRIAVFLDRKKVGEIRKVIGGFQYFPNGGTGGGIYQSIQEVKQTLEAE